MKILNKISWTQLANNKSSDWATNHYLNIHVAYLSAYLSVLRVWSTALALGATQAIIQVRDWPRKESLSTWVSLLCLNGVWRFSWSRARIHSLSWNRSKSYNLNQTRSKTLTEWCSMCKYLSTYLINWILNLSLTYIYWQLVDYDLLSNNLTKTSMLQNIQ